MKTRIALLALAVPVVFLAVSCQGGGIYWTLENEVKINDLSLPNEITVFDVTKIDGTPGSYYAAAGKIWTAAEDFSTTWTKDERVFGPASDAICKALVTSPFGSADTLFGGFITPEANLGLYESGASPTEGPGGTTWTAVPDSDVAGSQIALLKVQNDGSDTLVVVTAKQPSAGENFQYGIVLSSDGINFVPFTFNAAARSSAEAEQPIWDVVYAGGAIGAWFATEGTKLFTKTGPGSGEFILATTTNIPAGEEFTGLLYIDSNIYIASKQGAVYYSADGTTWTSVEAPLISGEHPPLTRFAGPILVGTDNYLLVGSDGYGYYRLLMPPATPALTRCPDTTDDLHSASVLKLFFDGPKDRVFACTSNDGLWRGDKDPADPVDPLIEYAWVQE